MENGGFINPNERLRQKVNLISLVKDLVNGNIIISERKFEANLNILQWRKILVNGLYMIQLVN